MNWVQNHEKNFLIESKNYSYLTDKGKENKKAKSTKKNM